MVRDESDDVKEEKASDEDKKALTEIRRAFHTIKGSGRMANVLDLSELAWKVENMLNQVITGVIPASEPMVNLVTTVRNQMPKMVDALKSGHSIGKNDEIIGLMIRADILASKKKVAPASAPCAAAAPLSEEVPEFHELNRKLEQCMQRANEALHRSEKALQQAPREGTYSYPCRGNRQPLLYD